MVVAIHDPHGGVMLEVIRELGLEIHVIFNRGAVLALLPGINKVTGVDVAVRRLGMSRHEVVGVGDGENDHSLLEYCECEVAVGNAVDSLKEIAAFVTRGANGTGVSELVDELIENDLHAWKGSWSIILCWWGSARTARSCAFQRMAATCSLPARQGLANRP